MAIKNRIAWAVVSAALLLAACANPVPPEKSAYVGQWNAPGMSLLITQDGSVDYKRVKGGVNTFEGDNFIVGVGLWTTTFVVSKPPSEAAGRWKMTVDGVELIRAATGQST